MPRLFVAVELPEAVKGTLTTGLTAVKSARWVKPAQLHLTLRFIGDWPAEAMEALESALSEVRAEPFSVRVRGVGTFGRPPRVLWAGLEPEPPLVALAEQVEAAVQAAGAPPEARSFSPHVTLARLKRSPPVQVRRFVQAHEALVSAPFEVSEVLLFSSELTEQGAVHGVQARFPLAPRHPT